MNKVTLMGRIGSKEEIKVFENDNKVLRFSLATSEKFKVKGEQQERTEWHNCECWNKVAETINNYIEKGDPIIVEGQIKTEKWESNGEKKEAKRIQVKAFWFTPSRKSDRPGVTETATGDAVGVPAKATAAQADAAGDDDLPF